MTFISLAFSRRRRLSSLLCAAAAGLALAACHGSVPAGAIGAGDVDAALDALDSAPSQGLAADGFGVARLRALSRSKDAADRAARDRGLHAALVAYSRAEHGLDVPATQMPKDWALRPAAYDAEGTLDQAVAQHRFRAWLAEQPPSSPAYRALEQAYGEYLKIAAAGGWPTVTGGGRLSARDPRAEALRQRLAFEDPTLAQGGANADVAAALSRFQAAHGLPATGALDAATIQELNVPAKARAAQIRANLERLRWLPRQEPATRAEVNTAAGLFAYYRDGRPVLQMLAAAGKPGDETPMLASAIDAVVLNPPWNVPDEIAKAEIYPKAEGDPDYLAAHGYEEVSGDGGSRLVQKPGADSALGLVKFDFKNPFAVYLHDTPSKAAFAKSQRSVSHGCVRLAQAMTFAKLLLTADAGWSPEKIDQVIASGQTTNVPLKRTTPVRLIYLTAFPDGGRIAFRPDVYGWDAQMLQLMDSSAGRQVAAVGDSRKTS